MNARVSPPPLPSDPDDLADAIENMNSFADSVGFAHGLKEMDVDYDAFGQLFRAKFKGIDPSGFENLYVKGHERGTERVEYAKKHGATRGPSLPNSVRQSLAGLGMKL